MTSLPRTCRRLWIVLAVGFLCSCAKTTQQIKPTTVTIDHHRMAVLAFNEGVRLLSGTKTDYHRALKQFLKAIEEDPNLYEAHVNLGILYSRGNDPEHAEQSFHQALAARPHDRPATVNLAALYLQSKRFDEGIGILKELLSDHPDDHEARNNLAVLYRLKNDYEEAKEQARAVLDRQPRQSLAYNNLATIFSELGQHEMAEDLFRRALVLDPDNARVQNNLGLARLKQDRVQEALELFLKAQQNNSNVEEAGINAASIYMANADYARAAAIYKKVAQDNPGMLPALVGEAVAERGLGRITDAEKAYQQILGLDPKHPDTLFNLGLLYMNYRDKPEWACEAFKRLLMSGRAEAPLAARAKGYIEDIQLSHPGVCAAKPDSAVKDQHKVNN
jgi:Tfp pilus assembly protein PilF